MSCPRPGELPTMIMGKREREKLKETAEMCIYAVKKSEELLERTKNEEASDEEIDEVNKEIDEFAVFVDELLKRDNIDTLKKMIEIVRKEMQ